MYASAAIAIRLAVIGSLAAVLVLAALGIGHAFRRHSTITGPGNRTMDSSAIGSLITIRNRLLPGGGVLALCALGEAVAKVLRITDLGKVFALHPDLETALAAHSA